MTTVWTNKQDKTLGQFIDDCRKVNLSNNRFRITVDYEEDGCPIETIVETVRLGLTYNDSPIVLRKRSRRWGVNINSYYNKYGKTCSISKVEWLVKNSQNEEKQFYKRLDKLEGYLKKYNLWKDIQIEIRLYRLLGYELTKKLSKWSWFSTYGNDVTVEKIQEYIDTNNELFDTVKRIIDSCDDNEIKELFNSSVGEKQQLVNEEYLSNFVQEYQDKMKCFIGQTIYYVSNLTRDYDKIVTNKLKKMSFHQSKWCKGTTERILSEIKEHMEKGEKYHARGRNGYDVSFEYNPETNRAWYSEEYKDCGNGHYYIAVDDEHALYCEDD